MEIINITAKLTGDREITATYKDEISLSACMVSDLNLTIAIENFNVSFSNTLGDFDALTLGYLDSFTLGSLDVNL